MGTLLRPPKPPTPAVELMSPVSWAERVQASSECIQALTERETALLGSSERVLPLFEIGGALASPLRAAHV